MKGRVNLYSNRIIFLELLSWVACLELCLNVNLILDRKRICSRQEYETKVFQSVTFHGGVKRFSKPCGQNRKKGYNWVLLISKGFLWQTKSHHLKSKSKADNLVFINPILRRIKSNLFYVGGGHICPPYDF